MISFLKGYKVLDLTDHRGLLTGKILADLGADVVQVEPAGGSPARQLAPRAGDGRSFVWEAFCAGKRSIVGDTNSKAFERLIASADFLLESGNTADALGFSRLSAINPRLILVSIRGFGTSGPKAHYAESDLILWAAGGAMYGTRDQGRPPVRVSAPQAYLHAAAEAAGGALIALFARHKTGRGQQVEVDVQKSVAQATLSAVLADAYGDTAYQHSIENAADESQNKKLDLSGSGSATQRKKSWVVKDGEVELHLAMGPTTGKFTNNLFEWIRDSGFSDAPPCHWDWATIYKRIESGELGISDIDAAHAVVRDFLVQFTRAELIETSIKRKLLIAPRLAIADLAASPHFAARGIFKSVVDDAKARIVGLPVKFSNVAAANHARPAPACGEHTKEVLDEWDAAAPGALTPPAADQAANTQPFHDLKVLDLSWVVAGPMIGRVLADFGAQVVRVESSKRVDAARVLTPFVAGERGLERSAVFHNCNAGKLGVTLDLTKPKALDVLRDLVRWCDVVVESYSFGTMKKWGLDYEGIKALNPRAILVSSTLMGQSGPYAPLAGFGNLGSAMSGIQALAGWPGQQPRGPFGPYTDYVGPRFGLAALLAVLEARRTSGEGCHIDISQAECGLQFLGPQLAEYFATGHALSARGNDDDNQAPHGVFACSPAGELRAAWVAIAAQDQNAWRALAELIGAAHLASASLEERKARKDEIETLIENWTRRRSAEQAEHQLQAIGVAAHRISTFWDFNHDEQLQHSNHILTLQHAQLGTTHVEASRLKLSHTSARILRPGPLMSEHNHDVLRRILGYDESRISGLQAEGFLA
ncbi:MAG: CoA transferase [Alphaproteobacteria bacterium]|nr:CoA transferase [Alphaproteobacteria bacterium]